MPTNSISPIQPEPGPSRTSHSIWRWTFAVLILAALVGAVLHFDEIQELTTLAFSARPEWLVLALIVQGVTYICAGSVWREALKKAGHQLPLGSLATLGLIKLFADQALPTSGMSGNILLLRGLARRDVPTPIIMAALLVDIISYYIAYLIAVIVGVGVLWLDHRANGEILGGATIFAVVVMAMPALILWLRHLGRVSLPAWTTRFPRAVSLLKALLEARLDSIRDPTLMIKAVFLQFSVFLLDSLTLWLAFRALGGGAPPFSICFAAFVVGSAAATMGPVPLGLGTFEAACVATLHLFGVPLGRSLAAVLVLRCLTFWLPMIPGLLLARYELGSESTK